jgi:DNA-binding transcriptional LysR family regulator
MEIDQLRTFLAVLEHGSFSRAAQALRVGQSTVSFHIKALETSIGARLLDRGGGGTVRSTETGHMLRRYAQRIVTLHDEAFAQLRAEESGERGRVGIAASTIPAEYLLPALLAEFRKSHRGVTVTVDVSDSRKAIASLLAQGCDFALVGAQIRDKRVVYSPFAEDEIVLIGPTSGPHAETKDLERLPMILREEGSGTREAVASLLARRATSEIDQSTPAIQVGSTEAARRCVLAGLGVSFLSTRAVYEDIAEGRLRVIPLSGTPIKRRFYSARLRTATPSAAARAFLTMLGRKGK